MPLVAAQPAQSNHNPPKDCPLCPRLQQFREANKLLYPDWHNGAVPAFGSLDAQVLMVGLAPGLKGANRTGRPFTGDYAGIIMYSALQKMGFAKGHYDARPDDGFELVNCRVTNAVRCVPPENKPEPSEIKTCNSFLINEIASMSHLKVILSQGAISHNAVLKVFGHKPSAFKFGHAAEHAVSKGIMLIDSYHCSRYNVNTGRLTQEMFDRVVSRVKGILK